MLESLGYTRGGRGRRRGPDPVQHLLDPREGRRALRRAPARRQGGSSAGRPDVVIGVGGCWAQSVKDEVFRQFPFVDVAFGPGQVHKLAEFLTSDSLTAQGFFEFEGFAGQLPMKRARDFQGWVQISAGCNMVCSFCIVPSTRGREVSRPLDELVAEVRAARRRRRARGHAARPERQLLRHAACGRSRGAFSRAAGRGRRDRRASTASATRARTRSTCARTSSARTPSSTSVCEHIHLPLQSGSSRVLKAMRRTYNRERYLDRVALIREHVPDCALTTDIIVGFPGETEADFARDARGRRGGRLRRRVHVHLLAAPRHRGGGVRRPLRRRTRCRSSGWSASSRSSSAARASARSASSAARSTCSSRARRATTRRSCAAARRTTRSSTSTGLAQPGEIVPVRDHLGDEPDAGRRGVAARAPAR